MAAWISGLARGFFITFEGGEGAGKSTQIARLAEQAARQALRCRRDPRTRRIARRRSRPPRHPVGRRRAVRAGDGGAAFCRRALRPCRAADPAGARRGKIVLCDRFLDSSRVYQGAAAISIPAFIDDARARRRQRRRCRT